MKSPFSDVCVCIEPDNRCAVPVFRPCVDFIANIDCFNKNSVLFKRKLSCFFVPFSSCVYILAVRLVVLLRFSLGIRRVWLLIMPTCVRINIHLTEMYFFI